MRSAAASSRSRVGSHFLPGADPCLRCGETKLATFAGFCRISAERWSPPTCMWKLGAARSKQPPVHPHSSPGRLHLPIGSTTGWSSAVFYRCRFHVQKHGMTIFASAYGIGVVRGADRPKDRRSRLKGAMKRPLASPLKVPARTVPPAKSHPGTNPFVHLTTEPVPTLILVARNMVKSPQNLSRLLKWPWMRQTAMR